MNALKKLSNSALAPLFFLSFPWIFPQLVHGTKYPLAELVTPMPYILFAVLGYLAYRVSRPRILLVSCLMPVLYVCLQLKASPVLGLSPAQQALVLSLAVPLFLIFIGIYPERRQSHTPWTAWLVAASVLLTVPALTFRYLPQFATQATSFLRIPYSPFPALPTVAILGWALYLGLGATTKDRSVRRMQLFTALSLIDLFLCLNQRVSVPASVDIKLVTALAFSSQGWLLLYGIFRLFWDGLYIDELTKIFNRRAMNEACAKLTRNYVISMVDIDHFKKINDTYGHKQGDHVLRYVATHLNKQHEGKVYRFGGEEFCIIFDGFSVEESFVKLEATREKLADKRFYLRAKEAAAGETNEHPAGKESAFQVTVSIGIAAHTSIDQTTDEVTKLADGALYQAKNNGRNRVVVAASPITAQMTMAAAQ